MGRGCSRKLATSSRSHNPAAPVTTEMLGGMGMSFSYGPPKQESKRVSLSLLKMLTVAGSHCPASFTAWASVWFSGQRTCGGMLMRVGKGSRPGDQELFGNKSPQRDGPIYPLKLSASLLFPNKIGVSFGS